MRIGRQGSAAGKTQVVVLTADAAFEEQARATFGASQQIALTVVSGTIDGAGDDLSLADATVAVIDLDAAMPGEMQALERLMARIGTWPPVIVVTQTFRRDRGAHAAADAGRRFHGEAGVAGRAGAHLRPRRQERDRGRGRDRGRNLHLPARGRRRRRDDAGGADRDDAAQQRARAASRRPAWSISTSSTAPAPTISTSSRASISARSSRGRSASTGNCWR